MSSVPCVLAASFWLLIKLLQSVLELCQVLDLILQHDDCIMLCLFLDIARLSILELAHLIHSTDYFMIGMHVFSRLRDVVRLIDDLDGSHIGIVAIVKLEVDIVVQEEVHESTLLVLGQLAEDESLRLGLRGRRLEGRLAARLHAARACIGLATVAAYWLLLACLTVRTLAVVHPC